MTLLNPGQTHFLGLYLCSLLPALDRIHQMAITLPASPPGSPHVSQRPTARKKSPKARPCHWGHNSVFSSLDPPGFLPTPPQPPQPLLSSATRPSRTHLLSVGKGNMEAQVRWSFGQSHVLLSGGVSSQFVRQRWP